MSNENIKVDYAKFVNKTVSQTRSGYCLYIEHGTPDQMVKEALKLFYLDNDTSFWVHSRFITDKRIFSVNHMKSAAKVKITVAPWFGENTFKYSKNDIEGVFNQSVKLISNMYKLAVKNDYPQPKKCPVYIRFFDGTEKKEARLKRKKDRALKEQENKLREKIILQQLAESIGVDTAKVLRAAE